MNATFVRRNSKFWTRGIAVVTFVVGSLVATPSHTRAIPTTFRWTTEALSANSTLSLSSLIETSSRLKRTWRAIGSCRIDGKMLAVHNSGRCLVRLTVAKPGRRPVLNKARSFKILRVSSESASGSPNARTLRSVWFPEAVPARDSDRWNVPISSYVRGRDVYPLDKTLPSAENAACEQATKVRQGVIILSFGRQVAAGASGFGLTIPTQDIAKVTAAWAAGLARCGTGQWELAVGTSNSGGVTDHNGFRGGGTWAGVVEAARAASDPRVVISGANDLEPGWGPPGQARAWVDGFVRATELRLWNFGSADGCPTKSGRLTCGNGWTIDDIVWVSSHAGSNIVAVPQIHTYTGSLSKQWALIAARAKSLGVTFTFGGMSVQTSACRQVRGGCPTTGISAWDGWQQLRSAIDAVPEIAGQPLGGPIDIRWGWDGPYLRPSPTTTTTTKPPTTTTSLTTTTTTPTTTTTAPTTTSSSSSSTSSSSSSSSSTTNAPPTS
jgi:hypothetical protein